MTFSQILESVQVRNWYAVAALGITFAIQLLRKWPLLRKLIWSRVPDGARFLIPMVGGAAVAFVAAYSEGQTLSEALIAALGGALTIGLGSMGAAAALKESPMPWDGKSGGKRDDDDEPPTGSKPVGLVAGVLALALVACSPAHWSAQRPVANAVATMTEQAVIPAVSRAYEAAGTSAVAASQTREEALLRLEVVERQWQPIWAALETFSAAHAAWTVAIESEGDTIQTALAVCDAYEKLQVAAKPKLDLPALPVRCQP
jgi:hypothetical protein